MAIPKKVREQAEQAKQLHEQIYNPKEGENDGEGSEPPAEGDNVQPKAEESVEPEPAVTEPAGEPEQVAEPSDTDNWQHKFQTLQGKYNAEVPRLHKEIRELRAQLEEAKQAFIELREQQVASEEPEEEESKGGKFISEDDIEDYGEDLIDVIRRAAKEEFLPEIERLREENAQLKQQLSGVSQVVVETAREKLLKTLDNEVPNWSTINTDEAFLDWLQHEDVFSGMKRHDLLLQAFESNDAPRVVAFFKEFIREHTTVSQPAASKPATPQPDSGKVDMESLVAPGRPRGGDATQHGAKPDGRVWTQSDIAAFYRDVQRGVYRGRESEKRAIEQDIIRAAKEGRLR